VVDAWAETIAAIALVGASIAVFVAWLEWGRLRATREQLALLQHQAREQGEKVERLGSLVAALRATVETKVQKLQISALERQVEMATAALKTQDTPLEVPRIRSMPGTAVSAAALGQVQIDEGMAPTGALGRFRLWAGWGRTVRGRDLGKGAPRNPEP
jgi:hypothetical protein